MTPWDHHDEIYLASGRLVQAATGVPTLIRQAGTMLKAMRLPSRADFGELLAIWQRRVEERRLCVRCKPKNALVSAAVDDPGPLDRAVGYEQSIKQGYRLRRGFVPAVRNYDLLRTKEQPVLVGIADLRNFDQIAFRLEGQPQTERAAGMRMERWWRQSGLIFDVPWSVLRFDSHTFVTKKRCHMAYEITDAALVELLPVRGERAPDLAGKRVAPIEDLPLRGLHVRKGREPEESERLELGD